MACAHGTGQQQEEMITMATSISMYNVVTSQACSNVIGSSNKSIHQSMQAKNGSTYQADLQYHKQPVHLCFVFYFELENSSNSTNLPFTLGYLKKI